MERLREDKEVMSGEMERMKGRVECLRRAGQRSAKPNNRYKRFKLTVLLLQLCVWAELCVCVLCMCVFRQCIERDELHSQLKASKLTQ